MIKKSTKIYTASIIIFIGLTIIAFGLSQGKKYTIDDYIGHNYVGKDPWGNKFTISLKDLNDNNLSWEYKDEVNYNDNIYTLRNNYINVLNDNKYEFDVNGISNEKNTVLFLFKGNVTLKDGNLVVSFEDGLMSDTDHDNEKFSFHISDLEDSKKTVTLIMK